MVFQNSCEQESKLRKGGLCRVSDIGIIRGILGV